MTDCIGDWELGLGYLTWRLSVFPSDLNDGFWSLQLCAPIRLSKHPDRWVICSNSKTFPPEQFMLHIMPGNGLAVELRLSL